MRVDLGVSVPVDTLSPVVHGRDNLCTFWSCQQHGGPWGGRRGARRPEGCSPRGGDGSRLSHPQPLALGSPAATSPSRGCSSPCGSASRGMRGTACLKNVSYVCLYVLKICKQVFTWMLRWLQAGFAGRGDINTRLSPNSFHLYSNQDNTKWLLLFKCKVAKISWAMLFNTVLRNASCRKTQTAIDFLKLHDVFQTRLLRMLC